MKPSDKLFFVAETMDDLTFYLPACCIEEAMHRASEYVAEHYPNDAIESVRVLYGEVLEVSDEEARTTQDESASLSTSDRRGQA